MASKSTDILTKAATEFASAKAGDMISNFGDRLSGNSPKDKSDNGDDNGENKGFLGTAAQKMGEGAGPVKSLVSGAGAAIKGLFSRKGGSKRPHNIVEDAFIGVAPDVCYAAFVQWEEFPLFMKGPTSVTRGDETPEEELEEDQHPLEGEQTNWQGKIFLSTRSWKATTVDYDPPNRVSWTSEGAKGTVDGTVTFTPVGDNATLLLMVLEYRSKGPIEWIGQRWQTVGRRSRLDLKHFKRYVMRTEPDELPEPEDAEEIPDEAKAEDASNAEVEEQDSDEETEDSDEPEDEDSDEPEDEDSDEPEDEDSDEPEDDKPRPRPSRRRLANA